jgi:hypothetical protein
VKIFWAIVSVLGACFWFGAAAGVVTVSSFGTTLAFIICGLGCVMEALRNVLEKEWTA